MMKQTAFVAMKFDSDAWHDRRYRIIADCLSEAGLEATRGDEIPSAGEVAREVLDRLRNADLVVIDSTGDSPNVSYELGYCHGVGRTPDALILLRQASREEVPLNYAHYRRHAYRDLRHLRRLLRERLDVSVELTDDQIGRVLCFTTNPDGGEYGAYVSEAVIAGLKGARFTGRCEYYAGDSSAGPSLYCVGLGLRQSRPRKRLSTEWWQALEALVAGHIAAVGHHVAFDSAGCEFSEMRAIRQYLLLRGTTEWEAGRILRRYQNRDGDLSLFESVAERLFPAIAHPADTRRA